MIAKYTPAVPIPAQTGDTFPEIAGLTQTAPGWYSPVKGFTHQRGAATLGTYLLKDMTRAPLVGGVFLNSSALPFAFYVEEFRMAAVAITMTDVQLDGDVYNFQFGPEGEPKTIDQLDAMRAELQSSDMAKKHAMVRAYAQSNGGADMTKMVGVAVTVDYDALNFVSTSE